MTQIQPISAFDVTQFRPAVMPGEAPDTFDNLYAGLCADLVTSSPLARVLCAQLAEAMIWYQRHQRDKWALIVNHMAGLVTDYRNKDVWRPLFFDVMQGTADNETQQAVEDLIAEKGYTLEILVNSATIDSQHRLVGLEKLIDRQFRTMRQLQKSIAEIEAKPLIMKRLALQVEQLTRDAQALVHDKPE